MIWTLGVYWVIAGHATFMHCGPYPRDTAWFDRLGAYAMAFVVGGLFVPSRLLEKVME